MPHDCALGYIPDAYVRFQAQREDSQACPGFCCTRGLLALSSSPGSSIKHSVSKSTLFFVLCFFYGATVRTSQSKSGECFRLCKRLGNCSHISFTSSSSFLEITDFHSILQQFHVNQFERNGGQIKNATPGSSPMTFCVL